MASSSATEIRASSPNAFFDALFILHRGIEREYLPLAWPSHMQEVLVFTEVVGGLGDIAAAAKAIAVMQRMSPNLHFDWALPITKYCCDPLSFLQCDDPSKVRCREWGTSYD